MICECGHSRRQHGKGTIERCMECTCEDFVKVDDDGFDLT